MGEWGVVACCRLPARVRLSASAQGAAACGGDTCLRLYFSNMLGRHAALRVYIATGIIPSPRQGSEESDM